MMIDDNKLKMEDDDWQRKKKYKQDSDNKMISISNRDNDIFNNKLLEVYVVIFSLLSTCEPLESSLFEVVFSNLQTSGTFNYFSTVSPLFSVILRIESYHGNKRTKQRLTHGKEKRLN